MIDDYIAAVLAHVRDSSAHAMIRVELEDHLYALVEEGMQRGLSETEAIASACEHMGPETLIGEQLDEVHSYFWCILRRIRNGLVIVCAVTILIIASKPLAKHVYARTLGAVHETKALDQIRETALNQPYHPLSFQLRDTTFTLSDVLENENETILLFNVKKPWRINVFDVCDIPGYDGCFNTVREAWIDDTSETFILNIPEDAPSMRTLVARMTKKPQQNYDIEARWGVQSLHLTLSKGELSDD